MDSLQQVVFSGDLCPGFEPADVRRAVQVRLRLNDAQLAGLFSGRRRVIKRGISDSVAQNWVDDFAALGAVLTIEPLPLGNALSPRSVSAQGPASGPATRPGDAGPTTGSLPLDLLRPPPATPVPPPKPIDEAERLRRRAAFQARHGLDDADESDEALLGSTFDSDFVPADLAPLPTMFGTGWQGRMGRMRAATGSTWLMVSLGLALWQLLRDPGLMTTLLAAVTTVAVLYWSLRLTVLRLHDLNLSGWLAALTLVPTLGQIVGLVLLLLPGTPTENNHGAAPPDEDWTQLLGATAVLLVVLGLLMHAASEAYVSGAWSQLGL